MQAKEKQQGPLKQAIDDLLRHYGLEQRMNERKIIKNWYQMVGPMIEKHTTKIQLKKDTLIVNLDSAALRQEMDYAKSNLIKELNQLLSKELIKNIVFR